LNDIAKHKSWHVDGCREGDTALYLACLGNKLQAVHVLFRSACPAGRLQCRWLQSGGFLSRFSITLNPQSLQDFAHATPVFPSLSPGMYAGGESACAWEQGREETGEGGGEREREREKLRRGGRGVVHVHFCTVFLHALLLTNVAFMINRVSWGKQTG
jgi:hypothetical protein